MKNEKRLIDANAFGAFLMGRMGFNPANAEMVLQWMDEYSKKNTVDAEEVVHGRWKFVDIDGWWFNECSICGVMTPNYDGSPPDWNYCPNCGAKMDGGENYGT